MSAHEPHGNVEVVADPIADPGLSPVTRAQGKRSTLGRQAVALIGVGATLGVGVGAKVGSVVGVGATVGEGVGSTRTGVTRVISVCFASAIVPLSGTANTAT